MKLNKIIIATILILGIVSIINRADLSYIIVTCNGAIIAVPYSTEHNLFGKAVNPGEISNVILKRERALTHKNLENHLVNCRLQPVVHQLLSRATLKILLALPRMNNKTDKSLKLCQRKKLHIFRLMINFTF
ncbi:Fimbria A protein precursor [Photorhabdus namnaonensis]|uniref:Fimbria A protein n=1 Tax=Photorhabdus namnaonensis TaxID=1851568 RepID=A0A1B8YLI3_9GAMM|nr:Fimbria A protein precursor [Photorhabdus namnaonensis]